MARGVAGALLLVTIDCHPVSAVLALLSFAVDFAHTRLYFHAQSDAPPGGDLAAPLDAAGAKRLAARMGAHFLYGLRLALVELGWQYVATLEDDLAVSEDFLELHADLAAHTASDPSALAVAAYPHGPGHDCHHLADKLRGRGPCSTSDPSALLPVRYFPGWGAGLPRRAFWALLAAWDFRGMVYDEILTQLVLSPTSPLRVIAACKPRVKLLPNVGAHGPSPARWDFPVDMRAAGPPPPAYHVLPDPDTPGSSARRLVTDAMLERRRAARGAAIRKAGIAGVVGEEESKPVCLEAACEAGLQGVVAAVAEKGVVSEERVAVEKAGRGAGAAWVGEWWEEDHRALDKEEMEAEDCQWQGEVELQGNGGTQADLLEPDRQLED